MPRFPQKLLLLIAVVATAAACKPKIGDECQLSTDCSAAGDRLCDITAPGGYCTVYNCEPDACPEDESLCVEFGWQRSRACLEPNAQSTKQGSPSPYQRSFCMATCESDSDCRDERYICADLSSEDNRWGALLIDRDRGKRACLVRTEIEAPTPEGKDVCSAELPDGDPFPDDSDSMSGAAGAAGAPSSSSGGAAGESGAGGASGAAGGDAGGQGGVGG